MARSREEEITHEFGDPAVACARAQTPLLFAGVALFVAGGFLPGWQVTALGFVKTG